MGRTPFIERVLHAAHQHGQLSDPDHEVGDLQDLARCLWVTLTPKQRRAFSKREDMNDLIVTWVDSHETESEAPSYDESD